MLPFGAIYYHLFICLFNVFKVIFVMFCKCNLRRITAYRVIRFVMLVIFVARNISLNVTIGYLFVTHVLCSVYSSCEI